MEFGACILGIPVHDTLKRVEGSGRIIDTVARETMWMAQTPQAFQVDLIKDAHERARADGFEGTDDASLVERLNRPVKVHPGSRRNLKITNKADLEIARALLNARKRLL